MSVDCEWCSDRDLIVRRCEQYRLMHNDLKSRVGELEDELEELKRPKDKDSALLEQAQAVAIQEKIALLEQQHAKDEKEKNDLRALNKRFLEEIKATKFNFCVVMDQLNTAVQKIAVADKRVEAVEKECEQLKLTLDCHETAQRILIAKVEYYESRKS